MREELDEFAADPSLEEAADMYEVLLAILENWNLELSEVAQFAQNKAMERGKFKLGVVLDEVLGD
ncbi:hypothetical protein CMO96_04340 [Candidatus Woesebacteria bacterium]|nr:hypothetical protein [Candidatus Woesebacteria bacterium]